MDGHQSFLITRLGYTSVSQSPEIIQITLGPCPEHRLRLVEAIYEAGAHAQPWDVVGQQLASYIRAQRALIVVEPAPAHRKFVFSGSHAAVSDYVELPEEDLWLKSAYELAGPFDSAGELIIGLNEFRKARYTNFLFGARAVADMIMLITTNHIGDVVICACQRDESADPFTELERAALRQLSRHFRSAALVWRELNSKYAEARRYEQVLRYSDFGIVFCDIDGLVSWANPAALSILSQYDGLSLLNGRLRARYSAENNLLREALRSVISSTQSEVVGGGCRVAIRRPSGKRNYQITVVPGDARSGLSELNGATVFIVDPSAASRLPLESLQGFFNLSIAEARLCQQIAEGKGPRKIAGEFGVSVNTIRTQLKSIFRKCEVSSQSELVRLLSSIVA